MPRQLYTMLENPAAKRFPITASLVLPKHQPHCTILLRSAQDRPSKTKRVAVARAILT